MTESSMSANGAKRILVVDDDVDTRTMLSLRLQREGYTVIPGASGADALDAIRREGVPNLVLLDIMLPDMDGFAVAEELRSLAAMPIIFLSAISDTDRKVEGISLLRRRLRDETLRLLGTAGPRQAGAGAHLGRSLVRP